MGFEWFWWWWCGGGVDDWIEKCRRLLGGGLLLNPLVFLLLLLLLSLVLLVKTNSLQFHWFHIKQQRYILEHVLNREQTHTHAHTNARQTNTNLIYIFSKRNNRIESTMSSSLCIIFVVVLLSKLSSLYFHSTFPNNFNRPIYTHFLRDTREVKITKPEKCTISLKWTNCCASFLILYLVFFVVSSSSFFFCFPLSLS